MDQQLYIPMEEFRKNLNLGRDYTYKAIRANRLKSWKPGRKFLIPASEYEEFPRREMGQK